MLVQMAATYGTDANGHSTKCSVFGVEGPRWAFATSIGMADRKVLVSTALASSSEFSLDAPINSRPLHCRQLILAVHRLLVAEECSAKTNVSSCKDNAAES